MVGDNTELVDLAGGLVAVGVVMGVVYQHRASLQWVNPCGKFVLAFMCPLNCRMNVKAGLGLM